MTNSASLASLSDSPLALDALYEVLHDIVPETPSLEPFEGISDTDIDDILLQDGDIEAAHLAALEQAAHDLEDQEEEEMLKEVEEDERYSLGNTAGFTYNDHQDAAPTQPLSHPQFEPLPFYSSAHALQAAYAAFATAHGFAVILKNSHPTRHTFYLACNRCSKPSASATPSYGLHRCSSIKTDCKWKVYARRTSSAMEFPERWVVFPPAPGHQAHNHPPLTRRANHSTRQLEIDLKRPAIEADLLKGIRPARIVEDLLVRNPNSLIRATDIYRISRYLRHTDRLGRSATEAAIKNIVDHGDLHQAFVNNDRELLGLFYTTHTARVLTCRFPSVIFLDCTYKTNRYGLRMLHFAGFTCTNRTFTMAVCWMVRETQDWYEAALRAFGRLMGNLETTVVITDRDQGLIMAVGEIWPHATRLTCTWHLTENVKERIATAFKAVDGLDGQGWKEHRSTFVTQWKENCVQARTPQGYADGLAQIKREWSHPFYKPAIDYLDTLEPLKHLFCHAWTDQHLHLGQRGNSRLEGNHRALKKAIESHHQDLYTAIDRLRGHLAVQYHHISTEFEANRSRKWLHIPRQFDRISLDISKYGLEKALLQLRKARKDKIDIENGREPTHCTHTHHQATGIPCSHHLRPFVMQNRLIPATLFHTHWRLPTPSLLDAALATSREIGSGEVTRPVVLPAEFDLEVREDTDVMDPPQRPSKRPPPRIPSSFETTDARVEASLATQSGSSGRSGRGRSGRGGRGSRGRGQARNSQDGRSGLTPSAAEIASALAPSIASLVRAELASHTVQTHSSQLSAPPPLRYHPYSLPSSLSTLYQAPQATLSQAEWSVPSSQPAWDSQEQRRWIAHNEISGNLNFGHSSSNRPLWPAWDSHSGHQAADRGVSWPASYPSAGHLGDTQVPDSQQSFPSFPSTRPYH